MQLLNQRRVDEAVSACLAFSKRYPGSNDALLMLGKARQMQGRFDDMLKNIEITHGLYSSQVILLALTQKNISREDAYKIVQRNAMKVWQDKTNFADQLKSDQELLRVLSADEIDDLCNIEKRLSKVDYIFNKVGL